jgi:diadenosine tetraphosphate (Ap4A) HIT family hydrolase
MTGPGDFNLDPRLARDTFCLGAFPLSLLLLMNDSTYPWLILVPQRPAIHEIYQLAPADQQQLLVESSHLAKVLAGLLHPDKLNIAALGNVVPQLHLHHVVRYRSDPAWPAPVWGKAPPVPYLPTQVEALRTGLCPRLESFTAGPARETVDTSARSGP